ncbi:hypothetical protein BpHYR1_027568 [Brachionus plicatilis]|uniref:Uncharacterized protein n=1 Tax=Brachionus plicatilis TaxID=10195 RepID=A0A3M7RQD6_BRAPC|nr:hypothetical protein BpHYR1_027568 [Brachionus plicatilis]
MILLHKESKFNCSEKLSEEFGWFELFLFIANLSLSYWSSDWWKNIEKEYIRINIYRTSNSIVEFVFLMEH